MTQEWMLKTLIEFGYKQEEAEIYLLLARVGPKKAREISDILKIHRRKIYRILKNLEKNELVQTKKTESTCFQAVPFENFLDSIIKNSLKVVSRLEDEKPRIFAKWKSFTEKIPAFDDNSES